MFWRRQGSREQKTSDSYIQTGTVLFNMSAYFYTQCTRFTIKLLYDKLMIVKDLQKKYAPSHKLIPLRWRTNVKICINVIFLRLWKLKCENELES